MARRIAIAILVSVWLTLVVGGATAYVTTRSVLLADLDSAIIARARALPELSGFTEAAPGVKDSTGDRYIIFNRLGQTSGRVPIRPDMTPRPAVLHAAFVTLDDGARVRSLTLRFTRRDEAEPVSIVYSGSAEHFDSVLTRLSVALIIFGIAAGAVAAIVAVGVARTTLKPLNRTASLVAEIDERGLDKRIDAESLPTELRPVAARLNKMLDRLQLAFEARKQFLTQAGHELRTPITALVTTIQVALRRPGSAKELIQTLEVCLSDSRMLAQLVTALLEQARSESVVHREEPQSFDAVQLLKQCADVADGLGLPRGITVIREFRASLPIVAEYGRLQAIVMNLLGNAVEYNRPEGNVILRAEMIESALELSVTDTGRGIASEDLSRVFEPFYRGSARRDHEASNKVHFGLGLHLVDSHVKALGGECRIESQINSGTVVRIRLRGVGMPNCVTQERI